MENLTWITPPPRPVYEGRSVVYRPNLRNPPTAPTPQAMAYQWKEYKTSQLNDASFSPLDAPVVRPYPGTQSTRRTPAGKPASVVALTPVPLHNPGVGQPANQAAPYAVVEQYKRPGSLGLVWTDPETQQRKEVNSLADLRDYYLSVRNLA